MGTDKPLFGLSICKGLLLFSKLFSHFQVFAKCYHLTMVPLGDIEKRKSHHIMQTSAHCVFLELRKIELRKTISNSNQLKVVIWIPLTANKFVIDANAQMALTRALAIFFQFDTRVHRKWVTTASSRSRPVETILGILHSGNDETRCQLMSLDMSIFVLCATIGTHFFQYFDRIQME